MGMKLKTCLASVAMLVATAAHAEGMASSGPSGQGDTTYRSAEASADQATDRYAASVNRETAGGQEHAMNPRDQHAGAGGGSGVPKVDRAATSPTEKEVVANWNRQEFPRNAWSTP